MAITFAGIQGVNSAGSDTTSLVSPSTWLPGVGDILVVVGVNAQGATYGTPTNTGATVTWTLQTSYTGATYLAEYIWTGLVTATSTSATQVTLPMTSGTAKRHSAAFYWVQGAVLPATPAVVSTQATGSAPSTTLTTVGNNSVIIWCNGDAASVAPGTPTYASSATQDWLFTITSTPTKYFAHQNAVTPGSQTIGITSPGGQTWNIQGIELQAVQKFNDAEGITDSCSVFFSSPSLAENAGLTDTATAALSSQQAAGPEAVGLTDSVVALLGHTYDFEDGTTQGWTMVTDGGGIFNVLAGAAHDGGYGIQSQVPTMSGDVANLNRPTIAQNNVTVSGWWKVTVEGTSSGSNVPFARIFYGAQRLADVYRVNLANPGVANVWLRVTKASGTGNYWFFNTGYILPVGKWVYIDFTWDVILGQATVAINGVQYITPTSITVPDWYLAPQVDTVYLGSQEPGNQGVWNMDTITVSPPPPNSYAPAFNTDLDTVTDNVGIGFQPAAFTDPVGITDAALDVLDLQRAPVDNVGTTDTAAVVQAQAPAPADPENLTDAAAFTQAQAQAYADPEALTDAVLPAMGAVRTAADNEALTDLAATAMDYQQAPVDNLGMTDALTFVKGITPIIGNDPVGSTDASSFVQSQALSLTETEAATDAAATLQDTQRTAADPEAVSDTASTVQAAFQTAADNLGLADAISASLGAQQNPADTFGITDTAAPVLVRGGFGVDPEALTDATAAVQTQFTGTDEFEALTDTAVTAFSSVQSFTEAEALTDAASTALAGARSAPEAVALTDALTYPLDAARGPVEAAGLADAVSQLLDMQRTGQDTIGLADALTQVSTAFTAATDALGLTDTVLAVAAVNDTATDTLGMTDTCIATLDRAAAPNDNAGITDAAVAVRNIGPTPADLAGIGDSCTAVLARVMSVSVADQVGILEHADATGIYVHFVIGGYIAPRVWAGSIDDRHWYGTINPRVWEGTIQ